MAPPTKPQNTEDADDISLANMNPPSSPASNEDMIPLPLPTTTPSSANPDSDSSSSSISTPPSPTHHKPTPTSRSKAKKARKAAHQTQSSKPSLRPAKDILSRIRHDPSLHESDFIVGYIDRHAPEMMEMDVAAWKGGVADVTDEEWIPQHRIMYFRHKGEEGRRVWDRVTRLDRLFGSGVAPVASFEEGRRKGEKSEEDGADVEVEELGDGGDVTSEISS